MRLSVKAHRLLDQAVLQFMVPFAGQERLDLGTPTRELDAVAPDRIRSIGECNLGWVAAVPAILGQANLFDGAFAGEGR